MEYLGLLADGGGGGVGGNVGDEDCGRGGHGAVGD